MYEGRHLKFVGLCGGGGNTGPARSRASGQIPKNMLTNFELKRLKPKLDIVKKPENRVHELTDSNVSLSARERAYGQLQVA